MRRFWLPILIAAVGAVMAVSAWQYGLARPEPHHAGTLRLSGASAPASDAATGARPERVERRPGEAHDGGSATVAPADSKGGPPTRQARNETSAAPAPGKVIRRAPASGAGDAGTRRGQIVTGQKPTIAGPYVQQSDVPVSLGDLRKLPTPAARRRPQVPEPRRRLRASPSGHVAAVLDPVAQTSPGIAAMPAPIVSFKGMSLSQGGAGWPPDTNGDVGPNHYVQVVNTSIQIFYKNGATAVPPTTFNSFFATASAPCNSSNRGDPIVLYDPVSGRWLITDFAWAAESGPFYECIAVSKTPDPVSGGWWLYTLQADTGNPTWLNDYPKLGVWADGYYMSANLFAGTTGPFQGTRVWALNRSELLSGQPLHAVAFNISNDGGLLPANLRGALPPAGSPEVFVDLEPNALHVWQFHVDWTTLSNSTLTAPRLLPVASYAMLQSGIPQVGSSETLDQIDDRLMAQVQYRRIGDTESLWLNHTVSSGGVAGVRWYELRDPNGNVALYQQGTYQPDMSHRWMGSLAVDGAGNMAVGYSVSATTMNPAIRYAGRLSTDPLGQLLQAESAIVAGTGSQYNGHNRWGDYSAMTIDPADDCTFWYTTEYYETTGSNWQTRIGSFRYPNCGALAKQSPGPNALGLRSEVTLSWSAMATSTYRVCVDATNNGACDTTWRATAETSLGYGALEPGTYYWQVRADTGSQIIDADSGTWWSFTVVGPEPPPPPPPPPDPGFAKLGPLNNATVAANALLLRWAYVPGVLYRVCVDTTNNNACDNGWHYTTSSSIDYSGLAPGTYYWQVREDTPAGSSEANGGAWWSFVVVAPGPEATVDIGQASFLQRSTNAAVVPGGPSRPETGHPVRIRR